MINQYIKYIILIMILFSCSTRNSELIPVNTLRKEKQNIIKPKKHKPPKNQPKCSFNKC